MGRYEQDVAQHALDGLAEKGVSVDAIAVGSWNSPHGRTDVAILDRAEFAAWCKDPSAPLPRVFWWMNSFDGENIALSLNVLGVPWFLRSGLRTHGGALEALSAHLWRPLDPQPEHRWNHVGGPWFCHGEHERSDGCSAHAEEIPCPFGVEGGSVVDVARRIALRVAAIRVERAEGVWTWAAEVVVEAA